MGVGRAGSLWRCGVPIPGATMFAVLSAAPTMMARMTALLAMKERRQTSSGRVVVCVMVIGVVPGTWLVAKSRTARSRRRRAFFIMSVLMLKTWVSSTGTPPAVRVASKPSGMVITSCRRPSSTSRWASSASVVTTLK